MSDDTEDIGVEVTENVGSALDELYLPMEAFGDAVVMEFVA